MIAQKGSLLCIFALVLSRSLPSQTPSNAIASLDHALNALGDSVRAEESLMRLLPSVQRRSAALEPPIATSKLPCEFGVTFRCGSPTFNRRWNANVMITAADDSAHHASRWPFILVGAALGGGVTGGVIAHSIAQTDDAMFIPPTVFIAVAGGAAIGGLLGLIVHDIIQ